MTKDREESVRKELEEIFHQAHVSSFEIELRKIMEVIKREVAYGRRKPKK